MALSAAVVPLYIGYGSAAAILIGLLFGVLCGLFAGFLVAVVGLQPIVAMGTESLLGMPYSVLICIVVVLVVAFLVRRTTFGLNLESIGANQLATKLAGVRIGAVLLAVYAINGLFSALSGIIVAARTQASDPKTVGLLMEMDAIAAVVIGGTSEEPQRAVGPGHPRQGRHRTGQHVGGRLQGKGHRPLRAGVHPVRDRAS